jgi:hypothetical protein
VTGQFIHYSSSQLRRKAKDDTKELVKQFQATINALMNARHKDALEMGRVLESSRQELKRLGYIVNMVNNGVSANLGN